MRRALDCARQRGARLPRRHITASVRILLLYPWLPAAEAGHGSAAVLAALLPQLGRHAEVVLVCGYSKAERELLPLVRNQVHALVAVERPQVRQMGVAARTAESAATAWKMTRHGLPLPAAKQWRRPLRHALLEAARVHAPQLLHIEIGSMAPYAALLPHLPSVLVDHEVMDTPPWPRFMVRHYRRCNELMALCRHDAEALKHLLHRTVAVRPVALPLQVAVARAPHPWRMLFVGSARHLPNHEALRFLVQQVLPAARTVLPEAQLRVVGATAADYGMQAAPGVTFVGRVPELAPEFAAAALVLAPVNSGGGVRVKNVEALQAGAALLTTPLGWRGLENLNREVAAVAELSGCAARAVALLQDANAREAMAARAFALCSRDDGIVAAAQITADAWARALKR